MLKRVTNYLIFYPKTLNAIKYEKKEKHYRANMVKKNFYNIARLSQQSLKLSQMKIKVQFFRLIGSLSELLFGPPISHHSLNPTFYHNRVSDASKMPDFNLALFSPNSL